MSYRRPWVALLTGAAAVGALVVPTATSASAASSGGLPSSYTAPPAPTAMVENHGSPLSSLTVVEGAFGPGADGDLVAYAAPLGENAELNVSSVTASGPTSQLARVPMPGASGDATIAVAPDGSVYVGTYYEGHLFRYDPQTGAMTDLGIPGAGATYLYGLSVGPDGTVYGGTFPTAHAWSYTPGSGFNDLGRITDDPTIQYARATAYDPEHHALYVGTSPDARVYRLDLDTGVVTRVALAGPATTAVSDLDYVDGRVFVNYNNSLRVIDTATATEVPVRDGDAGGAVTTTYRVAARGVSEARGGGVFFSTVIGTRVVLARYDLATDTVASTGAVATRGALIGYGFREEPVGTVLYALAGNYSGGAFRYELATGRSGSLQLSISPAPSPLQHVLPTADGSSVYVNAFLNGNTSRYDVASRSSTAVARVGQVEDWVLDGDTIQAGTYPNGALVSLPAASGNPLTTYTQLKESDQQIRPLEAKLHDGEVWYGTEPDYGLYGGAVAVLDPATGSVDVTRGVVPDQTISALEFDGDVALVGSSTTGGQGTDPVDGEAHLVRWDRATKTVLADATPVPGAGSVTALTMHDGRLFGLADSILFVADPTTLQVTRRVQLNHRFGGPNSGELWFHPNGYLYVSVGDGVLVVDPLAFTVTTLVSGSTQRLELSATGSLWTTLRPEGFTSFLDLGEVVPAGSDCADADTREHVTVFGTTTTVLNRFLRTGCTLQDGFPRNASAGMSYSATVQLYVRGLQKAGTLTAAEANALARAARAGRA